MHEAELAEKKCRLARGRAEGSQPPTNVPHSKYVVHIHVTIVRQA